MSLLMSEPHDIAASDSGARTTAATRQVDTANRLHAWSIPLPRCVHGLPFDQYCEQCDVIAPLERAAGPASR
jgi:hypothetical protein